MHSPWLQNYDPVQNAFASTALAALPVIVLLGTIAFLRIKIHLSAMLGLSVALALSLCVYRMPWKAAGAAAIYGAGFGLFPVGWIILNVMFLYQLTVKGEAAERAVAEYEEAILQPGVLKFTLSAIAMR